MLHLYFAPLEGITTYPYRNLHHKYFGGVDKYFTPFLAPGPEQGMSVKEMRDVLPENNAGVLVVPQILTNRAGDFLLASKKLLEMGYREINLNLGCPSGTVTAKKKGSGFLLYPDDLDRFFDEVFSDAAVRNGEFLVSVKTRIGKNEVEEWPELMQVYNRYPIHELTVHPRIQKEFYKGTPHLDVFTDILKESRNPVVYNGDLFTVEKVKEFREKFPTVGTVMIGRGLIRNPALAEMILQEETEPEADILPTPAPQPQTPREEVPEALLTPDLIALGVPEKLAPLMSANNVTPEELQAVVGKRGYFPEDMPIRDYPADFVEGCLVAAWPQVLQMVLDSRDLPF